VEQPPRHLAGSALQPPCGGQSPASGEAPLGDPHQPAQRDARRANVLGLRGHACPLGRARGASPPTYNGAKHTQTRRRASTRPHACLRNTAQCALAKGAGLSQYPACAQP